MNTNTQPVELHELKITPNGIAEHHAAASQVSSSPAVSWIGRVVQVYYTGVALILPTMGCGTLGFAIYTYVTQQYVFAGVLSGVTLFLWCGGTGVISLVMQRGLENRVKDLMKVNEDLVHEHNKLDDTAKKLQLMEQQWKKDALEAQQKAEKFEANLNNKVKELGETAQKLSVAEQNFKDIQNLYEKAKQDIATATEQVRSFNSLNKLFDKEVKALSIQTEDLGKHDANLRTQVGQAENAALFLQNENKNLDHLLKNLQSQMSVVEDGLMHYKKAIEMMEQHKTQIDVADDKFKDGTANLKDLEEEKRRNIDALKKLQEDLKKLNNSNN